MKAKLLFLLLVAAAIPLTVFIAGQQQDVRERAQESDELTTQSGGCSLHLFGYVRNVNGSPPASTVYITFLGDLGSGNGVTDSTGRYSITVLNVSCDLNSQNIGSVRSGLGSPPLTPNEYLISTFDPPPPGYFAVKLNPTTGVWENTISLNFTIGEGPQYNVWYEGCVFNDLDNDQTFNSVDYANNLRLAPGVNLTENPCATIGRSGAEKGVSGATVSITFKDRDGVACGVTPVVTDANGWYGTPWGGACQPVSVASFAAITLPTNSTNSTPLQNSFTSTQLFGSRRNWATANFGIKPGPVVSTPTPTPTPRGPVPSTPTPTRTPSPALLPADVDRDGCIGVVDFTIWRIAFQTDTIEPDTYPDINGDSEIDILDFTQWHVAIRAGQHLCQ